jgi:hypothetical protein
VVLTEYVNSLCYVKNEAHIHRLLSVFALPSNVFCFSPLKNLVPVMWRELDASDESILWPLVLNSASFLDKYFLDFFFSAN